MPKKLTACANWIPHKGGMVLFIKKPNSQMKNFSKNIFHYKTKFLEHYQKTELHPPFVGFSPLTLKYDLYNKF